MIVLTILNSILLVLMIAYLIRSLKKKPETKVKLTKEEKEKLEKAKAAFENLMKYDYDEAIRRK